MLTSAASKAAAPVTVTWRSRIGAFIAACCLGGGGWLGYALKDGAVAVEEVAKLLEEREQHRRDMKALTATAHDLRQHAVDATLAYDQAAQRLGEVAAHLEKILERERKFDAEQRKALEALLAQRPDLRALRLGPDVLQHWNRSNQGAEPATTAAGARPAGEPAHAVPDVPLGDR